MPDPAAIVPPVIDHEYVAPVPALGTEAVLPVEFAHTALGAVIVELGADIGMVVSCEPPLLHPLAATVQFKTTLPLAFALKVI